VTKAEMNKERSHIGLVKKLFFNNVWQTLKWPRRKVVMVCENNVLVLNDKVQSEWIMNTVLWETCFLVLCDKGWIKQEEKSWFCEKDIS
jgi:hypothetical protein